MPPMPAWDGRWEWSTQSTEGWEWGLLSTPWRPDRAHTLKVKSKANGKMTGKGAGSQSHLLQIQIQACLLALFSVYGCMVIQPYLGGQKKKKKILFLDANQAHLLREFQADVGEHQASSSRDTGVPQNINATKCSLKKHLRGRWHCEVLNIMIPFWENKKAFVSHKSCTVVYDKALRSPAVLRSPSMSFI